MNEEELKQRTKQFALRVMKLAGALPDTPVARTVKGQLTDAGTSVGANYRSACRARSLAEFVAKIGVVEEEADESAYWLELVVEGGLMKASRVVPLLREANELFAIMASSHISAARHKRAAIANRKWQI